MDKSCTTCKWAKVGDWDNSSCEFPLPAWLKGWVSAMESARGLSYANAHPDVNEFNTERGGYKSCPTWEARPVVDEEKQKMEGAK